MATHETTSQDILERVRSILDGTGETLVPSASACCSSAKQAVCCEPSEKADCCGTPADASNGCGCA